MVCKHRSERPSVQWIRINASNIATLAAHLCVLGKHIGEWSTK